MHVGVTVWTQAGEPVGVNTRTLLSKLVRLPHPPIFSGSFRADVRLTTRSDVGGRTGQHDAPVQVAFHREVMGRQTQAEHYRVRDAGCFTFMNTLPPHVTD